MDQRKVLGSQQNPFQDSGPPGEGRAAPEKHAGSVAAETKSSGSALRRSQRVSITVPVLVYGNGKNGEPFQEETHSLVVNAHGGLILLAATVALEQKLHLTNPKTTQEVLARVAYLGRTQNVRTEVGVGFIEPSPRFWHINFPPEDWDPSERKLPPAIKR